MKGDMFSRFWTALKAYMTGLYRKRQFYREVEGENGDGWLARQLLVSEGSPIMSWVLKASAVSLLVVAVLLTGLCVGEEEGRGATEESPQPVSDAGAGTTTREELTLESRQAPGSRNVASEALEVLGAVEEGWRKSSAEPFGTHLGKAKVRIDLGDGGPRGGLFTRSQAYYLLSDYLEDFRTVELKVDKSSAEAKPGSRPYILLERAYRTQDGARRKQVVFVSLRREDGGYVISELRAIPSG